MATAVIELDELILSGMLTYGPWALGLATMLSALGLPLPATMLLLAAGAFARQGALEWPAAVALAALGAVLGDGGSYLLGRFGGGWVLRGAQDNVIWQRAKATLNRWGALAIFLTRFLLTPLALPVNLIAGSTRYAPWRFAGLVLLGEVVWVAAFGSLGYLFADRWEALSAALGDMSGVWLGAALLLGLAALIRRRWAARTAPVTA
jgi:membrane protein DedA with SNARE-associated domain